MSIYYLAMNIFRIRSQSCQYNTHYIAFYNQNNLKMQALASIPYDMVDIISKLTLTTYYRGIWT
ncbi:hypothetical protein [Candidatus Enterovibrio escicola]|uniref:hypothetical protein n=1 Tax=Candidatus Enterovibrio escicola TaxID=1927127 RepID=UPI0012381DD1|nr:hypothetical protein [Candidatus Enterovibrio escacola]